MHGATVLHFPAMPAPTHHSKLPNRLRFFREQANLTLEDLAPRVGLKPSGLSKMERGDSPLTVAWMERIARELKISPADLLNETSGGLTEKERNLIDTYREVPPGLRGTIDAVAESQQPYRHSGEAEVVPHRRSA